MAFRKDVTIDSDRLMADLGQLEAASERVRLAGFGLAAPLLALRVAQQRRELARLAARKGGDHPEVAARQAALARSEARTALFQEELERARLDRPSLAEPGNAGLWGRVAEQGRAVAGATVTATAQGARLGFQCTGPTGGFGFAVPAGVPVILSVRGKDGAELHRDAEGATLQPGQFQYREIDLARGAAPPCPEPPETAPPRDERFPMIDLVGQREATAIALLRAQRLGLAARKEEPSEGRAGIVLAQEPQAGTPVAPGAGVTLVIGAEDTVAVPDLIGTTRTVAEAVLKNAGLALGTVRSMPVQEEKTGLVLEQAPDPGGRVKRGSGVDVTIGIAGTAPRGGEGGRAVSALAARAERLLRESGGDAVLERGGLAERLAAAGVDSPAALDALLAEDGRDPGKRLGLRKRETELVLAALKRAREEEPG